MRVFDVCGTLYDSNTTFEFITEYHKYRDNRLKVFWTKMLLSFPFKLLNKLEYLSIRDKMIATLQGEEKSNLETFAKRFVSDFLCKKEKSTIMELLLADRNDSVLVSASIDPVIDAIAAKLKVKAYSSILEFDENSLSTGKLAVDLKGIKSSILDVDNFDIVATDNMSDIDLIKLSKLSYIVSHKDNKDKWLTLIANNSIDLNKVIFL